MRKKIRVVVLLSMTLLVYATNVYAQGLENYHFSTGDDGTFLSPSFTEIISSGNDDITSGVLDIGFPFLYDGVEYTQFSVNSNGRMRLGSMSIGTNYSNPFNSTNYSENTPAIAGVGRDCSTGAAGYVKTGLYSSGTLAVRVIECLLNTSSSYTGTNYIKFQFQLYQGSNEVRIVYSGDYTNAPSNYQVGIGNVSADKFWYVNPSTHTATYSTTYTTDSYSVFPGGGRYYSFIGSASVPYICDFENNAENSSWTLSNSSYTNYWMFGGATSSSSSNSMYITNDGSSNAYTNTTASYVYACRSIYFASAGDYVVSFKWKARGETNCWDAMFAALVPSGTACPPASNITGSANELPSGYINVADVSQSNNTNGVFLWTYSESDWLISTKNITISTAGEYTLVFYWKNDTSVGSNPPAAVDDIEIATPCTAAASLIADAVSTSVALTRTSGGDENYEILVSTSSNPETATESPVEMTSATQTITGLTPATQYYAYIRSICSEYRQGEWSSAVSFVTTCDKTSTLSVEVQGSSRALLTRTSGNGVKYDVLVSTSSNPEAATETPVTMTATTQTITGLAPATRYYAYIRSYCTEDIYGAWSSAVSFVTSDACPAVTNLVASAGVSSADISWTYSGSALWYQLFVSPSAINELALEDAALPTVTSCSYTATGLSSLTTYYVYVRPVCNAYDVGQWTSIQFTTRRDVFPLPYYEDFEGATASAWEMKNGANGWFVGTATNNGGDYSLYISSGTGTYNTYINTSVSYSYAYCRLNVEDPCIVNVSFDWKCYGEQYYDMLRAFIIPVTLNPTLTANAPNGMDGHSVATPNGWIDVSQQGANMSNSNEWIHSSKNLQITYAGEYYLVFFWKNDSSAGVDPPAAVDNISVEVVSNCLPVENVTAGDVGKTAATISWDEMSSSTQWQVIVSTSSSVSSATETPVLANTNSLTISNLEMESTYYAFVRAYCSDSEQSDWSEGVEFTTLPLCGYVADISIDEVGESWVNLSWTNIDTDATQWQVLVSTSSNVDAATETPVVVNSTTTTVDGLASATSYYVYVRSYCSEYGYSQWESQSFRTSIPSMSLPYTQDFESGTAENWMFSNGTNGWYVGPATSNGGAMSLYVSTSASYHSYNTSSTSYSYAYCLLDVEQPCMVNVSFDWKSNGESKWDVGRVFFVPENLNPQLQAGNANGMSSSYNNPPSGWISLTGSHLSGSDSWQESSMNIALASAGRYYLVFFWKNDSSGGTNPPAAIDNISIEVLSTCLYDSYVYVSDVGKTSATVSWDDSESISQWEVLVTTASSPDEATETSVFVSDNSYNIIGLASETDYNVFVRAYCSESNPGIWNSNSFTTLPSCLAVENASLGDYGRTSINVSWDDVEGASQWQVLLTTASNIEEATETPVLVDNTTPTIDGLESDTRYYAYVRAYCSETDQSHWVYAGTKVTLPPCVTASNIHLNTVNSTTALIEWEHPYTGVFWVCYSETELDNWGIAQMFIDDNYSIVQNGKCFLMGDLTPGQTYHVYISASCLDQVGSSTESHRGDYAHFQFTTPTDEVMSLPYYQDFEVETLENWHLNNNTNAFRFGTATAKDGEKSLYVSGYNYEWSVAYSESYSYAYCRLYVDHPMVANVSFDWIGKMGSYGYSALRAFMIPASVAPDLNAGSSNGMGGSYNDTPENWIDVSEVGGAMYGQSSWTSSSQNVVLPESGEYYFVFFWKNQSSYTSNPPAAIDNLSIEEVTDCIYPEHISITETGKTSFTVEWTSAGYSTQWEVLVTTADSPEEATETPILANTTTVVVEGLEMNSLYNVYVRSICSGSTYSTWSGPDWQRTLPPCEPVYDATAIVTQTSAKIRWLHPYNRTYYYTVLSETEMTPEQLAVAPHQTTSYLYLNLSDLTPGHTYHEYIAADCGDGDISEWVHVEFTTTEQEAMTLPYYEDFDDGVVQNWIINNNTNGWYLGSAIANESPMSMYISPDYGITYQYNSYYSVSYAYCRLNIDHRCLINVSYDWTGEGMGVGAHMRTFLIPVSVDPNLSAGVLNGVSAFANTYDTPNGWIEIGTPYPVQCSFFNRGADTGWLRSSKDITISEPGDYYLVYFWGNNSGHEPKMSAAVDNISVTHVSDCIYSGNITADFVGNYSADVSWTYIDGSQWEVLVTRASNASQATETPVLVSSPQYSMTGLNPSTTYRVFVRTYCSESEQSPWSDAFSFTTAPPCLPPTNINASVMSDEVTLHWSQPYSYNQFQIVISPAEMSDAELDVADYEMVSGSLSYSKDGLLPGQSYHAYISSGCANGEISEWADFQFETPESDMVDLPYVQNFESNAIENWRMSNGTNGWYVGSAVSRNGAKSLYVSGNGGSSNQYNTGASSCSYAYIVVRNDSPCVVNLSFDWRAYGESGYDYMEVYCIPYSYNPGFSSYPSSSWPQVGGEFGLGYDWQHFSSDIQFESSDYYIVFVWNNDGSVGTQPPAAIDNISIRRLAEGNDIVDFSFAGAQNVQIDAENHTVTCYVAYTFDLSRISPNIVISDRATINPVVGTPINLNNPFVYTVTSESGQSQQWIVTASRLDVVEEAEIVSFWTEGQVDVEIDSENATVVSTVSRMYGLTDVSPVIGLSAMATIVNARNTYNFTEPLVLTVRAESGATKNWTISMVYTDVPLGADCYNPYVVDAGSDLPYSNYASTNGLYNILNTYYSDRPSNAFVQSGNDVVYRIDLPYRMMLDITVTSSQNFSAFVMNSCGSLYANEISSMHDVNSAEFNAIDLPAGSSYVIIDSYGENVEYLINIMRVPYCFAVNNIEVVRLQNELDVTWSSDNIGDSWILKYGPEGFDIETEGVDVMVSEPHYEIVALEESTRYDVYVQANCSASGISDWTMLSTSTISSCQSVEDFRIVEMSDFSATISWQGFNMTQWEVQYKSESETEYTTLTVDEPICTFEGLEYSTTYNLRVRAICDYGTYSDYVSYDFTTMCLIVRNFPYVEDFDGEAFPPMCWSQERTAAGSGVGVSYANGAWMQASSALEANSSPKAMLADTKAGSVHNLVSSDLLFAESINGYDISIDVYCPTMSAAAENEGVEVWVNKYADVEHGNPQYLGFVSKNYQTNGETAPGWYTYTFNTRRSGLNHVILVGKSNNAGGVYVDNLTVVKAVDCIPPSNLVVESTTDESVVISWNDRNSRTENWTVRYSIDGGEQVETMVDEPFVTIGGLLSGTTYDIDVEVSTLCAAGMSSESYEQTVSATTDCTPFDAPYAQDFDVADSMLPDCWKSESDRGDVWSVSNAAAHIPIRSVQCNAHLLSPKFNFESGKVYLLEFDLRLSSQSAVVPDTLSVKFMGGDVVTLNTIVIQNAASTGMVRMSVDVPQYVGAARFDFVLNGFRECIIDNFSLREKSTEAEILAFEIPEQTSEAIIDSENAAVLVYVAYGTDVNNLVPAFTISENATVDVQSGVARDFSEPVGYIVTAEDGVTTKDWIVSVIIDENYCPNPLADDIDLYMNGTTTNLYILQAFSEISYNLKVSSHPIDPETEESDLFDGVIETEPYGYGWQSAQIDALDIYPYYYVYVQSNCGATGWTEKTVCGVFSLPYEQDFSDRGCWEIYDNNGDNKTWSVANGEALYSFSRTNQADDYLVSPGLNIVQNARLEFKYKVGNFSYPETFSVWVMTGNSETRLDSLTVNNESYQTYGPVSLADFAGQVVFIEIRCHSEANRYRLYVDDFKVDVSDFVINVSSVGNGSVSPEGRVEVEPDGSVEFEIIPDEYNSLVSLTLDGEDVTAEVVDGIYAMTNVNAEHNIVATFTERYPIRASAGVGGQIVTDGVTVANIGDTVSFVVIPDEGYRAGDIIVDGVAEQLEQGSYIYTFENVDTSHTIHATFDRIIYHTLYVNAGANGIVTPSGNVVVEEGEDVTISVIPDEGFIVHDFIVDGRNALDELLANGNIYTFENITADHSVRVLFVENVYYTVNVSYGEHGHITPDGEVSVANGDDQTFLIVPDAGYHIVSVTVDGEEAPSAVSAGEYTFAGVDSDHTIHAEFAINTYNVVAYAQGGTITPSGTITVNHGDSLTFEIVPDDEYELLNALVDNVSVEIVDGTYSFDSISADHAIVVIFAPMNIVRHEITATASEHGRISPSGTVRVVDGENREFSIEPDEHYYVSSLLVDGEQVEVSNTYLFENVTVNHTISASFEAYKHTVAVAAGEHGSVSPSGELEVDEGSDITLAFTPNVGYMVSGVLVDGVSVEFDGNTYTLQNVLEDHVVRVNFDLLPMWTITAVSGANGTITPNGTQYLLEGDDMEFTFVPDEGYMIDRVVVDGQGFVPENNTYVFENVTENHYIYVSFRTMAYFITATAGPHGELTPSGVVEVVPGASQVFTFNPYIGYELDSVWVDGEYVETSENTYEFAEVDANHTFRVTFKHITVSIDDAVVMSASLYPNPNDGSFMVDFAGISGEVTYQLVDAAGSLVDVRDIYVDEGTTMEFRHDLKPGVYFARFISDGKVLVERFVVE